MPGPATSGFDAIIHLTKPPVCPICAGPLEPHGFEFVDSVAVCIARCSRVAESRPEVAILRHPLLSRDVTSWRGLFFFTPHPSASGHSALALWLTRSRELRNLLPEPSPV
jgi:hypothetical protein